MPYIALTFQRDTFQALTMQPRMRYHATICLFSLLLIPRPHQYHQECRCVFRNWSSTRPFAGPHPAGISSSTLHYQQCGTCYQGILCHCPATLLCGEVGVTQQWPLGEGVLCRYVTYLGQQGLKYRTYLSGLRLTHIHLGLGNPIVNEAMPKLEYVLMGIKRVQARQAPQPLKRLPITIEILRLLQSVWVTNQSNAHTSILWAAACPVFWGVS